MTKLNAKGTQNPGRHPGAQAQHPTDGRQLLEPQALVGWPYAFWIMAKSVTTVATVEAAYPDFF
jgi:hypothetical protein